MYRRACRIKSAIVMRRFGTNCKEMQGQWHWTMYQGLYAYCPLSLPIGDGLPTSSNTYAHVQQPPTVRPSIEVPLPPFKILRRVFTAISTSPSHRAALNPTVIFSFSNPTPNCSPWPPSQSLPPLPSVIYRRRRSGTNARWHSSQVCSFLSGSLPD